MAKHNLIFCKGGLMTSKVQIKILISKEQGQLLILVMYDPEILINV